MNFSDLKLYLLNSFTLAISFANVEAVLKIILLIVSIFYTLFKILELKNKKDEGKGVS
jgi:hypothetical protein